MSRRPPIRRASPRSLRLPRVATLFLALACATVVAGVATACNEVTAPLPAGAIAWNPPARFALWWQMTESCSGRQGDLRAIKWYIVPDARSVDDRGKRVQGVTIGDRIVLADAFTGDGPLVRHEMLHALLRGINGHPREAFLVACNDIVVCDSTCAADAGGRPMPTTDAPVLLPRDVAIRVEVVPQRPAASQDGGAVAVIVSITNPLATPAWVRLAPTESADAFGDTFGLAIDYAELGSVFVSAQNSIMGARFPLGANETRRWVWDGDLSPGDYGIRGWFNDNTTLRFVQNVAP